MCDISQRLFYTLHHHASVGFSGTIQRCDSHADGVVVDDVSDAVTVIYHRAETMRMRRGGEGEGIWAR